MVKNEIVYLLHNNVAAGSGEALIEIGEPVYQINTGGWETQGAWEHDTQANPSPYVGFTFYRTANGINWNQFFLKKSRVSYSNMEWDFPVENGGYVVTLYFVESPETSQVVGSRVFDVTIEGRKALEDFDILHYAGSGSPVSFNFYVSVR